ncbi:phage virion morphogenesis protein [Arachidicoccus soli]|uniref:Phage morphogenesis protein n=1 Tax=Arachidicoccus soli TaxID=2341117 RepID=A0A386HR23_9BACT|nr:phage virion morphogenesis protein [Arachidicoccus soli]AYD48213.1 hypothetical protein D6B99_11755 [Arachidicoccus soli]
MNPNEFNNSLSAAQAKLRNYTNYVFPVRAGNLALLFISGNFYHQGWRGANGIEPWKKLENKRPGKILIKSGRLMRGNYYTTSPGVARVRNDTPYARVHNSGFYGTVSVRASQRKKFKVKGVDTGRLTIKGKHAIKNVHEVSNTTDVRAHTRKMNMPQRQFMPTSMSDSAQFANVIRGEIQRELKSIFPQKL